MNPKFQLILIGFLPLTLLTGLFLFLHFHFNWKNDGLFINLATEIIGIIITIFYVDYILRVHEDVKWKGMDQRITNRIKILLNSLISGIRNGINIEASIINIGLFKPDKFDDAHREIIKVAENVIKPSLPYRLNSLDRNDWKRLMAHLTSSQQAITSFIHMFQNRLTPDQISLFLDMLDALNSSSFFYSTFPDLADSIGTDNLAKNLKEIKLEGLKNTGESLGKVIELTKMISASV